MDLTESRPRLSVAVVCYEMAGQVENTLRSLLPPYQREMTLADYEIIVVDNGSAQPLPESLQTYSSNLRYLYLSPNEAQKSPAARLIAAAGLFCASLGER